MSDAPHCPYPAHDPPISLPLTVLPEHPCPYLPAEARFRAFATDHMDGDLYHQFLDAAFRRNGQMIYQPACLGCRQCLPIRVPVGEFKPTRSQRRCWQRNADLNLKIAKPDATDEKFELYKRYQAARHQPDTDRTGFEEFLYRSPVDTIELTYRLSGQLVAAGICDGCKTSLSSVYFYFDPAHQRRGLGTYGALSEIAFAAHQGIPYYYLGYWVKNCAKMSYKAGFGPHEILYPDGCWRDARRLDNI